MEENLKKGTTTTGIVCADGVVMATDTRATMGHLVAHETVQKMFKISEHMAMTIAGTVGDAQKLVDVLKAEMQLIRMDQGIEPHIDVAAKLLSNILYGGLKSFRPYMIQIILGGKGAKGEFKIFSLDPVGSSLTDEYIATGSGCEMAYGVLQSEFKKNMTINEAIKIIQKAMESALKRDVFTGGSIEIVVVDKKGYRKVAGKGVTSTEE